MNLRPDSLSLRPLSVEKPSDVRALQDLLEAAPAFHLLTEGRSAGPSAARDLFADRPPGVPASRKVIFGLSRSGGLIGCADLLRDYPTPGTAYLGLLLFMEGQQGHGSGPEALSLIEALAGDWGCSRLRLAVIATHPRALAFWQREGFIELYRKPMPAYTGEAIVMERHLR